MLAAKSDSPVSVTADACVVIRAEAAASQDSHFLGDPHARLFVTDEGRRMAAMAKALDPVYVPYNLARYTWVAGRLAEALRRMPQVVLLGSGYDTRALSLFAGEGPDCHVFELDFPATLDSKRAILTKHGIAFPSQHHLVPADLTNPGLGALLRAAGFAPERPSFVLAEGVMFFLPPEAAARLLEPAHLGLAPGSTLLFDCWSNTRIRRLNAKVAAKTGRALFAAPVLPDDPAELKRDLRARGYDRVSVMPLRAIARSFGQDVPDPTGAWRLVEAAMSGGHDRRGGEPSRDPVLLVPGLTPR